MIHYKEVLTYSFYVMFGVCFVRLCHINGTCILIWIWCERVKA